MTANIQNLVTSYQTIVKEQENELQILKRKIFRTGTARLIVILTVLTLTYILWHNTAVTVAVLSSGLLLFLFLLKYHDKLYRRKNYVETKHRYLSDELKGIEYDFSAFDGAAHKTDHRHRFASDLDLFGENSLFQSLNRTVTSFGTNKLAETFLSPSENKEQIQQQQKAVKELNEKHELILHFTVKGMQTEKDKLDTANFAASVSQQSSFHKSPFWNLCLYIVPAAYLIMAVLAIVDIVPTIYFGALWVVTLTLSLIPSKKMQHIAELFEKKTDVLRKYSALFRIIEEEKFVSAELENLKTSLKSSDNTASKAISQLKYYCDCLELAFTYPILFLFNPLLMWNVKYAIKIEKWIDEYGRQIESWFSTLAEFDALTSLAIFAHNHPEYVYPTITEQYTFSAKELGHPLLNRDKCVKNDVNINSRPFFMVVTGANMAGKSTYLRTVGVNHTLACVGAPVCAAEMTVYPSKLITNLRTADSLNDNESYFFAELKRLKMIIDHLHAGETLLVILDEILKGTNSIDKQKGSLALIKQLISLNSNGIIATHDLVLGILEKEFPDKVKNYRFEAEIKDDNLIFSYKIQDGIAQNMNATFLMQKMGINPD
jgi:ABC-type multidrug transport system fused ATPase/permease subunit